MNRRCFVLVLAGVRALARPDSRPPELKGKGWRALLDGRDTSGWHSRDGKPHTWYTASDVRVDPAGPRALLSGSGPAGPIMINGPNGRTTDFLTDEKFGDIELYLEFLIAPKSNSGVYVQGLYEVQILDSYGVATPGIHDCGAIYERWIDNKGVGGTAPSTNASRKPGEWQSFHIWFRTPRFNPEGKKIRDAYFERVILNGVTIHERVAAPGPTRASLDDPEATRGPLMLQGDHGPVAFRRIFVRPLTNNPRE